MTRVRVLSASLIAALCVLAVLSGTAPVQAQTADTTAPTLTSATVVGNLLTLTYDEDLDTASVPDASAYSVAVGSSAAAAPNGVAVKNSTVTLTLATAATVGDTVTLSYTVPSTGPVADVAGNDAAALTGESVVNSTPMVSNLGQGGDTFDAESEPRSQSFTTGCNPAGYNLSGVQLRVLLRDRDFTVSLHETARYGLPGTLLYTLSLPSDFATRKLRYWMFTAPEGATLEPTKSYSVVIDGGPGRPHYSMHYYGTFSDDEDPGKTEGWSIDNHYHARYHDGQWRVDLHASAARLAVHATPIENNEPSVPDAPTVSNLERGAGTVDGNSWPSGQAFTTGCHEAGYNLSDVQMRVSVEDSDFTAAIYSTEHHGAPGSLLYPLSLPGDLSSPVLTFTAPADAKLDPLTSYSIVIDPGANRPQDYMQLYGTTSQDRDPGTTPGWRIAGAYYYVQPGVGQWRPEEHSSALRMAVTATPVAGTAATGQPSVTGTAQVGETLTASTEDIEDEDGLEDATFSYQWFRDDDGRQTQISGATSNTYTLTDDDAGKKVRVEVSFTDDDANAERVTSDAWPASGTIVADPTAVRLSLSPSSVNEGEGGRTVMVTGTLNEAARTTATTVTVAVGAPGDTATEGTDYTTVNDLTLTIPAGQNSGTASFTLDPTNDDVDEDDETLSVSGTATGLSVTGTTATIVDDDTREVVVSRSTLTVPQGGAGGGPPPGPAPSEVDFEWTVTHDIEQLANSHEKPTGMWSDDTTLWLLDNPAGSGDAVYAYDLASGERAPDREFDLDETNRAPRGIWSDGATTWVSDSGQDRLFAHDAATGRRAPERDIELAGRNADARGIWSDGKTMWVLDGRRDVLFAYDLDSGELLGECELDPANADPHGIWSDRTTVWVSNHDPKRLFAYRLPTRAELDAAGEDKALERVQDEEFTQLSRVGNNSPRGLWSDGDVMYVADANDGKVYSYNMPDAIDARLATLSLEGVEIGEFAPGESEYEGVPDDGVTQTTVAAEAAKDGASVVIDPPDADEETEGHQVDLEGVAEITVAVTSSDGGRERTYRVTLAETGASASCLRGAVAVGFSLVLFEGGSLDDLVSCAQGRHVTALYALSDGEYVPYFLGAPEFVNARFAELFADGVPALLPLVVRSEGPATPAPAAPAVTEPFATCLLGEIGEGFSLVVYEGGSVADLEACAAGLAVTAVYALVEGEYVPYFLGAPEFVTASFRTLFPDGVPAATPLTVRGAGPPGVDGGDGDGTDN